MRVLAEDRDKGELLLRIANREEQLVVTSIDHEEVPLRNT